MAWNEKLHDEKRKIYNMLLNNQLAKEEIKREIKNTLRKTNM